MIRVAINGLGRIGRLTLRNLLQSDEVQVVAVNDLTDSKTIAHLFKYDTAHGIFPGVIQPTENTLNIAGQSIKYLNISNPEQLPWSELEIDIVLECTGAFRTRKLAQKHITAGAKRVVISSPAQGGDVPFLVLGVNDEILTADTEIISNASCTTNCLAPIIQLIEQRWGIKQGFITTTHGYTVDQRLQDAPHKDLRRARAAAQNIIPTSTGAATAVEVVLPALKGKLKASALRVPVITGSLIELTCVVNEAVSVSDINAAFKEASETIYKDILAYNTDEIVSSDIVGNPHSSIFDAPLTQVLGSLIKVTSWYDNESGYAARMSDLTLKMGRML